MKKTGFGHSQMEKIRISIITPCYNAARTIDMTLESVKAQKYGNMEHIIIDGGSTDDTLDIVHSYADSVSYPVTVVSEPDNGIYDAMNKGIQRSSGDLIGIINADDRYSEGAINLVLNAYTTMYPADDGIDPENGQKSDCIIYGMMCLYEGDRLKSMDFYHHDFLRERMINHPGSFVSRSVYDRVGLFNTGFKSSADYEWMMRAYDAGVTFIPVYDVLTHVMAGGMSASNVGFRETLKLQYKWGQISGFKYAAYSFKSRIGDLIRKIKR